MPRPAGDHPDPPVGLRHGQQQGEQPPLRGESAEIAQYFLGRSILGVTSWGDKLG